MIFLNLSRIYFSILSIWLSFVFFSTLLRIHRKVCIKYFPTQSSLWLQVSHLLAEIYTSVRNGSVYYNFCTILTFFGQFFKLLSMKGLAHLLHGFFSVLNFCFDFYSGFILNWSRFDLLFSWQLFPTAEIGSCLIVIWDPDCCIADAAPAF